MLKGIHPLLTPDLLHALASMGHGDAVAIVDANFPAASLGPRVIELPGASSSSALAAVLTVFPVDKFESPAVITMQIVDAPDTVPEAVNDFVDVFAAAGLGEFPFSSLERHAFYERARRSNVVVRTGELRPYGNILLVKGVINAL